MKKLTFFLRNEVDTLSEMKLLLREWLLEAFKMIKENSAHSQIETIIIDASDKEKVIEAINAEIDDVIKAIKPRVI